MAGAPGGIAGGGRGAAAIAAACLLLTLFFFAARFPYDRFRAPLVSQLAAASGAEVQVGMLSGGLGLGGITLVAEPVLLRWPGGTRLELTRAALRPAWSLSWLRGRPALRVGLDAPAGRLDGTLWPRAPLAFSGGVRELALEQLPPELLSATRGLALTGRLDADAELTFGEDGLGGELELEVRDGTLSPPGSPVSIPFERLEAELGVASGALQVEAASLEGPMLAGSARGRVGLAPDPSVAPLDLQLDFRAADPSLASLLGPLGIRLDAQGHGRLHLQGTVGRPILR